MLPSLRQAIEVIKAGDKETGRKLLADILQADLENELAWLWLSSVVDSDEQRRQYLQRVLEINPDNQAAQRGLAKLEEKLAVQPPQPGAEQAQVQSKSAGPLLSRIASTDTTTELQSSLTELQKRRTSQPEQVDEPPVETPSQSTEPSPELPSTPQPEPTDVSPQVEAQTGSTASPPTVETAPATQPPPSPGRPTPPPDEAETGAPSMRDEEAATAPQADQPLSPTAPPTSSPLAQLWPSDQRTLVIAGGVTGLAFICLVCIVAGLIFQPALVQIPPLAAVLGTATPPPTLTPIPTVPPPPTDTPTVMATPTPEATLTATPIGTRVVPNTPTVTPSPTRTVTPDRNFQTGQVVGVVEGDIIDVMIDGVEYRVKYILVDAPAINDPEKGTEPFGPEALEINRLLVEGQTVTLEKDEIETDDFGRLLRYVYVGDLMVNEELLRQSVARVELVPPNLKYAARFQEVERAAQATGVGIWSLEEFTPPALPQVVIVAVNNIDEYVDIQNTGSEPQDLAGWRLVSELDGQECTLGGLLQPGQTLRIWALLADTNQEGYNCGFTQNIWSNTEPDPAVLYDLTGREISRLD